MSRLRIAIVATALVASAGCRERETDGPREYFGANRSGSSADFGIMKNGSDHVATVHGFVDDLATCQEIIDAMNANACAETDGNGCLNPFSCQPLNH